MAKATLYSIASTHLVVSGTGTYYGMLVDRDSGATGGTVVLADLLDAGASPDIHAVSGAFVQTSFGSTTAPAPFATEGRGVSFTDGLTLAYTSTSYVTVYYDD